MRAFKQTHRLMVLIFIFFTSTIQVYASDIDASIYVDGQQKLHLMWQGSNTNITTTSIQLMGPMSKYVETLGSHYRFDNLVAGKYEITLTQGSNTSTYQANIGAKLSKKLLSRLDAGVSLTTFKMKSFDDSAYPEFALSFQALDADDNPIVTLTSEDFSLSENDVDISDYIFRAPSGDEVTKIADVVVIFDDTASMGEEITQLKNNVKSFADKLVARGVDVRFRLISYKDDANDGWAWTSDVEVFKTEIASLRASGGNSIPEDGFEAIDIAADYSFRSGAQKVFLFITDARSYEGTDEYGKPTPTKAEINQKLIDNGINLYAIAFNNSQYNGAGSITEVSGGKWFPISSDFTDVVNEIGNTVGGVYQVAWSALDTTSENLEIKLKHTESSQEITHTYIRNLAPRVTTFPDVDRVVGSDITIGAEAIDADNLIDATLMYREHRIDGTVATWVSVKSLDDLNGRANFIIPGSAVTAAGLDYIVWFKDEKGAKGFSKKQVLTVGTSVILPSFKVTSHILNDDLDFIFILEFENLAESANLKFYFQGSSSGVFIGEVDREIKEGDSDISYEKLSAGKYKVTLKKPVLSTADGVIGVVKLIVKIGDVVIDGSGKEFDNPVKVNLYVERNADTIILTNFNKLTDDTSGLRIAIQEMVKSSWNLNSAGIPQEEGIDYNMKPIVVDLDNASVLKNGDDNLFQMKIVGASGQTLKNSNASDIIKRLNLLAKAKLKQHSIGSDGVFLLLVGSHAIIPYGQAKNQRGVDEETKAKEETEWYRKNLSSSGASSSLSSLYNAGNYASDANYRKYFKVGRLVETSSHIESLINNYKLKQGYLLTNKNFRFIGGYDHNNESDGFFLTRWFKNNLKSKATGWKIEDGLYDPSGVDGEVITKTINSISSGIIDFEGHGNFNSIENSKKAVFGGTSRFYAGRVRFEGDATELESLKNKLIFSNACHIGVNYSSLSTDYNSNKFTDFPEAFVNDSGDITANRSLGVFIGNTAFGRYSSSSVAYGDKLVKEAILKVTSGSNENIIYTHFYNIDNVSGNEISRNDLLARPQFYGIPNFRVGPKTNRAERLAKKSSLISSKPLLLSRNTLKISDYLSSSVTLNAVTLEINLTLDIRSKSIYDEKTGKLIIVGIDDYDRYNRPELTFEIPVPVDAKVKNTVVDDEITENKSYTEEITTEDCNTDKCYKSNLVTTEFNDLVRVETFIVKNKLYVRLIPVQYKTSSKEALLTEMLKIKVIVDMPRFILDTDRDGLPNYWEDAFGFDLRDPTGENGANADPDKDGKTNEQEYAEQTNPRIDNRLANDIIAPEVPTSLVATPRENAVNITFTAPADAVQVQVFYGVDSDSLTMASHKVLASDGEIDLNGLDDETTYHVVARAYDASGNLSDASSAITFTIPKGVGPDLPQVPVLDNKTLVVKNPTDSDFNGFHLYISNKASMESAVSTFKLNDEGVESRIDLSRYFVEGESRYAQIVGVDSNNHEGTLSKVFELRTGSDPGDANADGKINSQDLIKIINHILGIETANGNPDCNSDGSVNSLDTVCIINKILGT